MPRQENKEINHNTPEHLIPVADGVNGVLRAAEVALQSTKLYKPDSLTRQGDGLLNVLQSTKYDGVSMNAPSLQRLFEPFKEYPLEEDPYGGSEFHNLVNDLPIVSQLEQGGLHGINARLHSEFTQLKASGKLETKEKLKDRIDKLNYLLLRAIYFFPHLATGIEVSIVPDAQKPESEDLFKNTYFPEYESTDGRKTYGTLMNQYQRERGEPAPETLIFPLPYAGESGGLPNSLTRHPSTCPVQFSLLYNKKDRSFVPGISLVLEESLMGSEEGVSFTLDEISSIRFSASDKPFTPYLLHFSDKLGERKNFMEYYLLFKSFEPMGDTASLRRRGGNNESLASLPDGNIYASVVSRPEIRTKETRIFLTTRRTDYAIRESIKLLAAINSRPDVSTLSDQREIERNRKHIGAKNEFNGARIIPHLMTISHTAFYSYR